MKVTEEEYNAQLANDQTALGFTLTMESGATGSTPAIQHFLVDQDPVTEIGRMTGYGMNLLLSASIITPEVHGDLYMKWRKIIKS